MVTFNYATIRKDENGKIFLDLEIQAVFNDQKIIIRNTFPATKDYLPTEQDHPKQAICTGEEKHS